MFCVWDLVVEGEGFKRESIVMVGERGEEFRLSGIRELREEIVLRKSYGLIVLNVVWIL